MWHQNARAGLLIATAADLGLSRKEIHEARKVRDIEAAEPRKLARTLDAILNYGIASLHAGELFGIGFLELRGVVDVGAVCVEQFGGLGVRFPVIGRPIGN